MTGSSCAVPKTAIRVSPAWDLHSLAQIKFFPFVGVLSLSFFFGSLYLQPFSDHNHVVEKRSFGLWHCRQRFNLLEVAAGGLKKNWEEEMKGLHSTNFHISPLVLIFKSLTCSPRLSCVVGASRPSSFGWHKVRDKLRPMRRDWAWFSVLLYVHGNHEAR